MDRTQIRSLSLIVLVLACIGCQSHVPIPLDPETVIRSVERARRQPNVAEKSRANRSSLEPETEHLDFPKAASWMLAHSPDIQVAVAIYRTAMARANVATPFPNPGLQVGPEYAFGSDVTQNHIVPFGSLSISIPLGARLGDSDALNQVRAEALRVDGLARHRELYLELRRRFVDFAVARAIEDARRSLAGAAENSVATAHRLVEAGQATALDVALFELEQGRITSRLLGANSASLEAKARLAALIGVHADTVGEVSVAKLPALPQRMLPHDILRRYLVENHAGLARLRARYEVAEASLRLEISKQYPDLQIGPAIGGETGDKKTALGLTLGIELPIFDRNQQAIAEARQFREELRSRYEAEANKALAELERAKVAVQLAKNRSDTLDATVLPRASKSIELAREALFAGSGDALRLLDAERSYREILIESLDAQLATRRAWLDLELSVGRPLVLFSNEASVESPAGLDVETTKDIAPGDNSQGAGK